MGFWHGSNGTCHRHCGCFRSILWIGSTGIRDDHSPIDGSHLSIYWANIYRIYMAIDMRPISNIYIAMVQLITTYLNLPFIHHPWPLDALDRRRHRSEKYGAGVHVTANVLDEEQPGRSVSVTWSWPPTWQHGHLMAIWWVQRWKIYER